MENTLAQDPNSRTIIKTRSFYCTICFTKDTSSFSTHLCFWKSGFLEYKQKWKNQVIFQSYLSFYGRGLWHCFAGVVFFHLGYAYSQVIFYIHLLSGLSHFFFCMMLVWQLHTLWQLTPPDSLTKTLKILLQLRPTSPFRVGHTVIIVYHETVVAKQLSDQEWMLH